jgi:hypothetical protein
MTCRQLCNGEQISIAVHDRYSVARKTRTSESLRAPVEILVSELRKSALSAEGCGRRDGHGSNYARG